MKERLFKSRVLVTIISMKKVDDGLFVSKKDYETVSGRALQESISTDISNGIKREVVEVDEAPRQFTFGVVYVLRGGKRAWIYKNLSD